MSDERMKLFPRSWFQTHTGLAVWPLQIAAIDIKIEDIARSLALTNRFNGHTSFPYSVAQHSLLVSRHVPQEHALEGLLHDAAEAYLGDLVSPIKRAPAFAAFVEAEHQIEAVIAEVFDLKYPWHPSIKIADSRALMTERRDVRSTPPPHQWLQEAYLPFEQRILEEDWRAVERAFLIRYEQLMRERHGERVHAISCDMDEDCSCGASVDDVD